MSTQRKPPTGNVRRAVSTGRNQPGVVVSKTGRIVQYESHAEHTLILCFDRDSGVRDYISQPITFSYADAAGWHSFTPDYQVIRTDGRVEIHAVLGEKAACIGTGMREAIIKGQCRARGWEFLTHTPASLPQATERANLLALFAFRPTAYANPAVTSAALARLAGGQCVPLRVVTTEIASEIDVLPAHATAALCHLLWHGSILTDLRQLIFVDGLAQTRTLVWMPTPHIKSEDK